MTDKDREIERLKCRLDGAIDDWRQEVERLKDESAERYAAARELYRLLLMPLSNKMLRKHPWLEDT